MRIFQSTFPAILIYGLDAFTLTDKRLQQIDGYYFRFLRRIVGIKASFYSRTPNSEVYQIAGKPRLPSELLNSLQYKQVVEVFSAQITDPVHNVVFASALKDRITQTGKRRGRSIPYWLPTTTKRFFQSRWASDHTARSPDAQYISISRAIRESCGEAPKRAQQSCAGRP